MAEEMTNAEKPKRPKSPYFLWMNENESREELKRKYGNIRLTTEMMKKVEDEWRAISTDKKKLEEAYKKEKLEQEKKLYNENKKELKIGKAEDDLDSETEDGLDASPGRKTPTVRKRQSKTERKEISSN